MNKLINLTPHDIIITGYGVIEPSGYSVKVHSHLSKVADVDGVPIMCCKDAKVSNLPDPVEGAICSTNTKAIAPTSHIHRLPQE